MVAQQNLAFMLGLSPALFRPFLPFDRAAVGALFPESARKAIGHALVSPEPRPHWEGERKMLENAFGFQKLPPLGKA
jgi:hypothetical protein